MRKHNLKVQWIKKTSPRTIIPIGELLPSPEDIKRYNDIIPEAAERIFKVAESQCYDNIKKEQIKTYALLIFKILILAIIVAIILSSNNIFRDTALFIPMVRYIFSSV